MYENSSFVCILNNVSKIILSENVKSMYFIGSLDSILYFFKIFLLNSFSAARLFCSISIIQCLQLHTLCLYLKSSKYILWLHSWHSVGGTLKPLEFLLCRFLNITILQ